MKTTLKLIALRYIAAVLLITVAGLVSDPDAFFIVIPVVLVSLKFVIYDAFVSIIKAAAPSLKTAPWFYLGYGLAVAGDMIFTWGATRDETDAGFAFLGTLLFTPWILIAAFVVMLALALTSRKRNTKSPKPLGKRTIIDG